MAGLIPFGHRVNGLSGGCRPERFEPDGSLRDVCFPGAGVSGWETLFQVVAAGLWPYQLERNGKPMQAADFSSAGELSPDLLTNRVPVDFVMWSAAVARNNL